MLLLRLACSELVELIDGCSDAELDVMRSLRERARLAVGSSLGTSRDASTQVGNDARCGDGVSCCAVDLVATG